MLKDRKLGQKWALASVALQDAYTDFMLSRQAILCSQQTMKWYGITAGKFVKWLEDNNVHEPNEISSRHIRLIWLIRRVELFSLKKERYR